MAFKPMPQRTEEQQRADDIRRQREISDSKLVDAVRKDLKRTGKAAPRLARGRMRVSLDVRREVPGYGDILARGAPANAPDQDFALVLFGARAELFDSSVLEVLGARRTAVLEARFGPMTAEDLEQADAMRAEIEVEGYWHTRWWKDRHGAWQSCPELLVARWTLLDPDPGPTAGEPVGWIPEALAVPASA